MENKEKKTEKRNLRPARPLQKAPQKKKGKTPEKAFLQPRKEKNAKTEKTEKRRPFSPFGAKTEKKSAQRKVETKKPSTKETRLEKQNKKRAAALPLRVMMLGGLQEIGKNLSVIEYGNEILLVDCGVAFPDEEMPGIDLVVADISYLEKNADKICGMVITHGHEDHIGGIPYFLQKIQVPIYATRLTVGIIRHKLEEHTLPKKPDLHTVEAGETVKLGSFSVEFIHANHSIADACCLAIHTPRGIIFHTGDFKIDVSPMDGQMMDLTRIGEIGREGVLLMMGESTNAERGGFTPSERKVGGPLEDIFTRYKDSRLVIATFSSNVHRVQQIINASVRHGRKVAVLGRSMETVTTVAVELGYMTVPEGTIIPISELRRYKPEEITLITTGSQGEPMSALSRMAFEEHDKVRLAPGDVVVLSSSAIPGNEKLVGKIINALIKGGVRLISDSVADVHVSGHACQEELKMMLALVKPRYFMPIHGEYRHLYAHKELAEFMGIAPQNIFVSENGKVLEIDDKGARFSGSVPAGKVLVDGSGVGDVGNIVLRDRKHLSEDGLVTVVATVDMVGGLVFAGPDVVSRGFVYVRESEELLDGIRRVAAAAIDKAFLRKGIDYTELKNEVRDAVSKYIFAKTKRRPMILPIIMNLS